MTRFKEYDWGFEWSMRDWMPFWFIGVILMFSSSFLNMGYSWLWWLGLFFQASPILLFIYKVKEHNKEN